MKITIIFLCVMMLVSGVLLAQINNSRPQLPPGLIDGAKNPDLIPDVVAYRLVFLSLADQSIIDKQDLKLRRVFLTKADADTLKQILRQFDEQYKAWRSEAKQERATEAQAFEIVQGTRDLLNQRLTSDGVTKFARFVETAKSRMIWHP